MPHKLGTWLGMLVIIGSGAFCWWAVMNYRTAYGIVDSHYKMLTMALFATPVVAVIALGLWFYFFEKD